MNGLLTCLGLRLCKKWMEQSKTSSFLSLFYSKSNQVPGRPPSFCPFLGRPTKTIESCRHCRLCRCCCHGEKNRSLPIQCGSSNRRTSLFADPIFVEGGTFLENQKFQKGFCFSCSCGNEIRVLLSIVLCLQRCKHWIRTNRLFTLRFARIYW